MSRDFTSAQHIFRENSAKNNWSWLSIRGADIVNELIADRIVRNTRRSLYRNKDAGEKFSFFLFLGYFLGTVKKKKKGKKGGGGVRKRKREIVWKKTMKTLSCRETSLSFLFSWTCTIENSRLAMSHEYKTTCVADARWLGISRNSYSCPASRGYNYAKSFRLKTHRFKYAGNRDL